MATEGNELPGAVWRASSRSTNGGQCVQVAANLPGIIAVRDSKNPAGGALMLAPGMFAALTAAIRDGKLS